MPSFTDFIKGIVMLTRPIEWSKTLGNMVIGVAVANYVLYEGFNAAAFNISEFILAFIAVGPLLWGGLYMLNDWTDWKKDKLHAVKMQRPIPSGLVSPRAALWISVAMIFAALALAAQISAIFLLCVFAMLVNQQLYTLKPFRLKTRPILDLISGSLINPYFRFFCGWVLVVQSFTAPWQIILFVLAFQFGGFTLYRLSGTKHEEELGYKSSAVVFGQRLLKNLSYLSMLAGGLAYLYACFTILPLEFLWLAGLSLLALPLYLNVLKDPTKMDMNRMYIIVYLHYLLFVFGFVVLFLIL